MYTILLNIFRLCLKFKFDLNDVLKTEIKRDNHMHIQLKIQLKLYVLDSDDNSFIYGST